MKYVWRLMVAGLLVLSGCGTENAGPATISTTVPMEAEFSPADSVIPFPNNLLFKNGTTGVVDGTLQVPGTTDPVLAMNTLDGFSTIAPISTTFSLPIDGTTVAAGVSLYEVFDAGINNLHTAGGFVAALTSGVDYVALVSPTDSKTLVIKPIKPLKSNSNYMVVVTGDLKSTSGEAARSSLVFTLLKHASPLVDGSGTSLVPDVDNATALQLEGLRQLTAPLLSITTGLGIATDKVAIAWTFKTQTVGAVLAAVQAASSGNVTVTDFYSVAAAPSAATGGMGVIDGYSFSLANGLPAAAVANIASVVIGAANLPYYLDDTSQSPLGPIAGSFTVDPYTSLPTLKSTQTVPYLLSIPNTAAPVGGWPVIIFQHGFTADKSVMFGIANTLASQGFATIAIDSVLHGDRTFALDLVNNSTGAAGPDGQADPSGTHYLNLASLLTARDNIRQNVIDLMHLTRLLEIQTMDVVNNTTGAPGADGTADLPQAGFKFVGHSNGGILGTMLMAVEPALASAVLANPGADYARILQDSLDISPQVNAGLAAQGVATGSADYNAYMVALQTVVDDGDPVNYAAAAAATSLFLLKTTPDTVVPNAQTDMLSLNLGLPQVSGNTPTGWPVVLTSPQAVNGFVNYTAGTHSSFLSPAPSLAATTAMQTDAVTFLLSGMIATSDTAVTE